MSRGKSRSISGTEASSRLRNRPSGRPVATRIHVGETGQVADDRPDRAAAPAAGRQGEPRRPSPPHLERHLSRQLEDLPVQEKESGQAEMGDQRQLLVEAHARLAATRRVPVALRELPATEPIELGIGRFGPV